MGGDVAQGFGEIVAAAYNAAFGSHYGSDGHFVGVESGPSFAQGGCHHAQVFGLQGVGIR